MSEPVTLEEAKEWMRVTHDDEDSLIQGLIVAAREYCETYTEQVFLDNEETPTRVKKAILILAADMYENREAQIIGQTVAQNPTVERLLHPIRALGL